MKTNFVLIGILTLFGTAIVSSCDNEQRIARLEENTAYLNEYIKTLSQTVNSQAKVIGRLQNEIENQNDENLKQKRELLRLGSFVSRMNVFKNEEMNKDDSEKIPLESNNPFNSSNVDTVDKATKSKRLLMTTDVTPSTIGFYAYLSKEEKTVGPHHTLIFDHVVTNIGEAYNKHSGDFVVPTSGVYVLSYTIVSAWSSKIFVELVINGNVVGSSLAESGTYSFDGTSASTVVLSLKQGDTCLLRTHSTAISNGILWSADYARSSFSGWKISS